MYMGWYFPGGQYFTHMIKSDLNYLHSARDETPTGGLHLPPPSSSYSQQLSSVFSRSVTYLIRSRTAFSRRFELRLVWYVLHLQHLWPCGFWQRLVGFVQPVTIGVFLWITFQSGQVTTRCRTFLDMDVPNVLLAPITYVCPPTKCTWRFVCVCVTATQTWGYKSHRGITSACVCADRVDGYCLVLLLGNIRVTLWCNRAYEHISHSSRRYQKEKRGHRSLRGWERCRGGMSRGGWFPPHRRWPLALLFTDLVAAPTRNGQRWRHDPFPPRTMAAVEVHGEFFPIVSGLCWSASSPRLWMEAQASADVSVAADTFMRPKYWWPTLGRSARKERGHI